jgi:hypothetical protein
MCMLGISPKVQVIKLIMLVGVVLIKYNMDIMLVGVVLIKYYHYVSGFDYYK